ncbi:hypothetical protein DW1_0389 [Proteiniborus sp. DW1]|uniref:Wadjet anti-phage system protein JetD domain-containing protein n=1 Tax=Proteiniborus sp. DW1 TaxID=1889883 RepID=UPI00092E0497|nr:Wadjet anti-phage system protein JetD domain-containing protein [Proteiniborus sp. DW1]SCG82009.1 hypothetical protein DW1_0389 [Proteiniborus sp. DW1]
MNNKILSYLKLYKNKTISLFELERIFEGNTNYEDFAKEIKILEEKDILRPVKSHHTNGKAIPLYNSYRINKSVFKEELSDRIQKFKLISNPDIDLQKYFELSEKEWEKDFPYIEIVNNYIEKHGFPIDEATSPERSYQIMGDEKWIDEKGGRKLLERLDVWEKFKISYKNDPLMLGVNPKEMNKELHFHMIVENKATFHVMLDILHDTIFTSLVYGAGWKIVSNVVMLEKQLGLEGHNHKLFYFGDMDYEGISIWNALNSKKPTILASKFYKVLLKKPYSKGKDNQKANQIAIKNFLESFNVEERNQILEMFNNGGYYPQESLKNEEISHIWRNMLYGANY